MYFSFCATAFCQKDSSVMENILSAIGHTPMVEIDGIYAKAEMVNPSGSIKDRMAYYMFKKAEERGVLKKETTIVELTSGNTGISFAMIAAIKGYKFVAIMPNIKEEKEKQKMLRILGAIVVTTPAEKAFQGAMEEYEKFLKSHPNSWAPKQFENPDNIEENRIMLGREIIEQMKGDIDAFVAGVGTGGTLIGVAKALKAINPKVKIIAVEPAESPIISQGKVGSHLIDGIGEGFVPKIIQDNRNLIDEIILVKSQDAIKMSKTLAKKHGLLVGISSGANVWAAKEMRKKYKKVVTVLPDSGQRYLNTLCPKRFPCN